MQGRVLGMRRPVFWGAVAAILLIGVGYFGARPVIARLGKKQRVTKVEGRWKATATTPEGANTAALNFNSKGNACNRRRQYAEALKNYRQALEVAREFNLKARAKASFEMIGNTFDEMGMADSAAIYYQKAQELAAVAETPGGAVSALFNRGVAQIRDEETSDSAVSMLRRAVTLAQADGDYRMERQATYNLGISYLYRHEPDSCISILRRYAKLHTAGLGAGQEALVLYNVGIAFCQKREWDSAYASFLTALNDYRTVEDKVNTWFVLEDIRDLGKLAGDPNGFPLPPGPAVKPPYRGAKSNLRYFLNVHRH